MTTGDWRNEHHDSPGMIAVDRLKAKLIVRRGECVRIERLDGVVIATIAADVPLRSGDHLAVRAGSAWRRYTVARCLDGAFDIIAATAHDGPAATMFRALRPGGEVTFRGPEAGWPAPPFAVSLGDVTALATMVAADQVGHPIHLVGAPSSVVDRWPQVVSIDRREIADLAGAATSVQVAGERSLVLDVRSAARAAGMTRRELRLRTYWAPGRCGLE